ncbi:MAG: glycosyltransferase family 4 protein, partial [Actinomycetota bacterium]|nr:glycosyltransferase family 4 protein [Actinomycetota bacterium]
SPDKVFAIGIGSNRVGSLVSRDWSVPRFLFVGKDWQRKNGDAVVRAFGQIRRRHPGAELHIVGGAPTLARAGITCHGLLRLEVAAERAKVDELFRRATCFVLPSLVEPSAIAYVEAATFGVASIASSVGGSRDLIGDNGILVDPNDDMALAAAMFMMCDPEVAAHLGRKAASRAELFTWSAVAARILTILGVPRSPLSPGVER